MVRDVIEVASVDGVIAAHVVPLLSEYISLLELLASVDFPVTIHPTEFHATDVARSISFPVRLAVQAIPFVETSTDSTVVVVV